MKTMTLTMAAAAALATLACPQVSRAKAVETINSLYPCSPLGVATLCYFATTTVPAQGLQIQEDFQLEWKACDLVRVAAWVPGYFSALPSVTVQGLTVFGGGYNESLSYRKDGAYKPSDCWTQEATATYFGQVTPCAPGSPVKWQHVARHTVNFIEYQGHDYSHDQSIVTYAYYLLLKSTCLLDQRC